MTAQLLDGIARPPVKNLVAVADRLGVIAIEASSSLDARGMLHRDDDGLLIYYQSSLSAEQQRFTIAHELGHALLEQTGPRPPRIGDDVERFCDEFASHLLMPEPDFSHVIRGAPSLTLLRRAARIFQTSLEATARRYYHATGTSFVFETTHQCWRVGTPTAPAFEEALQAIRDGDTVTRVAFSPKPGDTRHVEIERTGQHLAILFAPTNLASSPAKDT